MRLLIKETVTVLAITAVISIGLSACKKIDDMAPFIPDRMFTPSGVSVSSGETNALISWRPSVFSANQRVTYKLEVYNNNSFTGTPAYAIDADTTTIEITDADIAVRTNYWVRVKANATASSTESIAWAATTSSFSISGEQLFFPIDKDYVTDASVLLSWKESDGLTHIKITPSAGGAGVDHPLTPADITALEKTIDGLTPSTAYTAEIFKDAASKGILTFSTKSGNPGGTHVITVGPNDSLSVLLLTAEPNTTFILPQGSLHSTDTEVILPENASFTIWGEHGPNTPIIAFNGFKLPQEGGTIRFENVEFTGYKENNTDSAKRNYIFNQTDATNIESIEFENCIIRNLGNSPLRLQQAASKVIDNLMFNNCIVYDIGDNGANGTYAFIHTNTANGKINNITITNSTLYKIGYSIILHNAAPSESVLIQNCTFDNTIGNGRYFIDYNAQSITSSFVLENLIIGKTLSPAETARGIRVAGVTPEVSNTFKTKDAVFSANVIAGVIDYPNNSTDLFTNSASGNFLIKDLDFAGKSSAGDPLWRP